MQRDFQIILGEYEYDLQLYLDTAIITACIASSSIFFIGKLGERMGFGTFMVLGGVATIELTLFHVSLPCFEVRFCSNGYTPLVS